jgi:hypothetical protein
METHSQAHALSPAPARMIRPSLRRSLAMARRDNDGGNTFMDFVWGVVLLLAFLILMFDL